MAKKTNEKPDEVVETMPAGEDDIIMDDDQEPIESTVEIEPPVPHAPVVLAPAMELLQKDLEKSQKDYLYLQAEYDNYRRQAIKERSNLTKYAGERLAADLLDTLDIFDTALEGEVNAENLEDFIKGIQLTAQQLSGTLEKHGITPAPALGENFDPTFHEALSSEERDDVPAGQITQVFKKPYKYHDKLLRPGQVVVAKEKSN